MIIFAIKMKEIWKSFMVPVVKKSIHAPGAMIIAKEDEHVNIIVMISTEGEIFSPLALTIEQEAFLKQHYKDNYEKKTE